jgi:hypothetical protein
MTLDIDQEAIGFIREKGGICLIYQIHIETTFEPIPHTLIKFEAPPSAVGLNVYEHDGVTLHVGRSLFFKNNIIRIRLGRFLFFRWLELPTMTMFCADE